MSFSLFRFLNFVPSYLQLKLLGQSVKVNLIDWPKSSIGTGGVNQSYSLS